MIISLFDNKGLQKDYLQITEEDFDEKDITKVAITRNGHLYYINKNGE